MIQVFIQIGLWLRYEFWRIILGYFGGAIGSGTKIYEGVKIYLTRQSGVFIGENCTLQKGAILSASDSGVIKLAKRVYLGEYVVLQAKKEIEIGEASILAAHTFVVDFDHSYDEPDVLYYDQKIKSGKVSIGKNVWIGAGCRILKGVSIGDGCVIGAGSVVTRDIPAYSVAVGVPARVIRERKRSPRKV